MMIATENFDMIGVNVERMVVLSVYGRRIKSVATLTLHRASRFIDEVGAEGGSNGTPREWARRSSPHTKSS